MIHSDAPMGAFISGGVDSSLIAAYGSKYLDDFTLFTANVKGKYSEFEEAKAVAKLLQKPLYNYPFEKEMALLEKKLEACLKQWQPDQYKSISSIKGLGKRATALLIIYTQGFRHTRNHRQLISFAGLSPTEYSSGSSIKGNNRIYKKGGKVIRDVLYMCAMNAKQTNVACKHLFDRLKANGKTGKQALIAVMNKLLKQVFAVVKNNSLYQPNYCSAKP